MSNLRIKNKKLKRELERLKGQTVQPKLVYDRREVVTLGCKHAYDDSLYGYIPEEVIVNDIVRDLADGLEPYIRIGKYRDWTTGNFVVEASVDVVSKEA